MLQLLQPIWLIAMAGIVVPVAIHLWNNKQGRVLAIGSIAFLEKTSLKKARSRRISEWWLLVLRCLLLILLSLLLAGPFWKRTPDVQAKKGWVLVGEGPAAKDGLAKDGLAKDGQRRIDSLVAAGFERHDLGGSSWWAGFAALDEQAPAGVPFYVFTDGRLEHFSGARPLTARPVYWQLSASGDTGVSWVEEAWKRGADSMVVVTGSSTSTGTSFISLETTNDKQLKDTPLRVVVYTDEKYSRDGQWVAGAIKALQQFMRKNIIVSRKMMDGGDASRKLMDGGDASRKLMDGRDASRKLMDGRDGSRKLTDADWVFWLSAQPLPADLRTANIFFYEPGRDIPVDTWIKDSKIPVERVVGQTAVTKGLQPIWADGFGRPLLAREETAGGIRYHFFSHFDPAWNGLVWSTDFPVRVEELLLDGSASTLSRRGRVQDIRVIDPEQVGPSKGRESMGSAAVQAALDLAPMAWALIFLTLLAERILSFKKAKNG